MTSTKPSSPRTRKLAFSGVFLALALVLPFATGQIPQFGSALCPMHLPVLLCGFVCGWPWGLAVGLISPLLRFILFGMPPLFPTGLSMAFELAAYGAFAGLLYRHFPKNISFYYVSLVLSMILGRLIWGAAQYVLSGLSGSEFGLSAFWAGAVVNAVPGILLQIVSIPLILVALQKAKLMLNE